MEIFVLPFVLSRCLRNRENCRKAIWEIAPCVETLCNTNGNGNNKIAARDHDQGKLSLWSKPETSSSSIPVVRSGDLFAKKNR